MHWLTIQWKQIKIINTQNLHQALSIWDQTNQLVIHVTWDGLYACYGPAVLLADYII